MFTTKPQDLRKKMVLKTERDLIDAEIMAEEWNSRVAVLKSRRERLMIELNADAIDANEKRIAEEVCSTL